MTTKVKITNDERSNGDVIINGVNTTEGRIKDAALRPGESKELWITTGSMLTIHETWPTQSNLASDGDIISSCGDSGEKWANAFCCKFPNADADTMRAWFANAIEAADAVRRERRAASQETL